MPLLPRPALPVWPALASLLVTLGLAAPSMAQPAGWLACAATTADAQRLACFDRWAEAARAPASSALAPASAVPPAPASTTAAAAPAPVIAVESMPGCRNPRYSEISRFWELENGSTCDTFNLRGYRPNGFALAWGGPVNTRPVSPNPLNTAATASAYQRGETRVNLSIRTKLAQGLLTQGQPQLRDSLWLAYTQQSYWQTFNGAISRPFRATDHEPELIYVYPLTAELPAGWRLRYGGAGLAHQSNGQSLPRSRSWNRVYLMTGAELDNRWSLRARLWQRLPEKAATDDNPDISDRIGRAELAVSYNPDANNTWQLTLRHPLRQTAGGSVRLEWLRRLADSDSNRYASGLRLHLQLLSGYGDSLIDYNRRRTVFSVGLSLLDF